MKILVFLSKILQMNKKGLKILLHKYNEREVLLVSYLKKNKELKTKITLLKEVSYEDTFSKD